MTLPELSVKRHVLAWMMSAVLVLVGIIGYQRVGLDRYPFIEFPVISITTTLKGANPDIVDSSITNVIESAVNSVPGIEHVQSTSSPGVSTVNITFALEKKVDVAFNEVQSKVNQVLRRLLPEGAEPQWRDPSGSVRLSEMHVNAGWVGTTIGVMSAAAHCPIPFLIRFGVGQEMNPSHQGIHSYRPLLVGCRK